MSDFINGLQYLQNQADYWTAQAYRLRAELKSRRWPKKEFFRRLKALKITETFAGLWQGRLNEAEREEDDA